MPKLKQILLNDTVLCLAILLACISSIFYTPRLSYIDFDVLCVLLSLMLVVAGLKSINFLDWLAIELLNKCTTNRQMSFVLIGITYFSSMFVTNDVALLTFVPLSLVIGQTLKMDMDRIIIIQTLAANLGSMLTPMGNPQNLFLYTHYNYTPEHFFGVIAVPCVLSLLYIAFLLMRKPVVTLELQLSKLSCPQHIKLIVLLVLLFINLVAVLHWLDKTLALAITAVVIFCLDRKLFKLVDYSLLITFAGFFIFIGNLTASSLTVYLQQSLLGTATGTYFVGLIASQFISNVPAAMLLAGLSQEADALLLGVNVGGLGTMIASMASVISYKLFAAQHPAEAGKYVRTFLYYNISGLLLLGGVVYFLLL